MYVLVVVTLKSRVEECHSLHAYNFFIISRMPVMPWDLWGQNLALVWVVLATPAAGVGDSHLPSVSWVCTVPAVVWAVLRKSAAINPNKPKAGQEEITDSLPDNRRKKP